MLNILRRGQNAVETLTVGESWQPTPDIVWIDLIKPTREEELAVEAALGLQLPTIQEMEALEPSSRLYQEAGATFMTATLLSKSDNELPVETQATFVLAKGVLITLRYADLRAFNIFIERGHDGESADGSEVFLGLLDAIVERLARILDETGDQVAGVSAAVFRKTQGGNFRTLLTSLAHAQSVTALARASLVSLARLLSFCSLAKEIHEDGEHRAHLDALQRDTQSLIEHTSHQAGHVAFLLDAALGLINIEQNGIIKFFSVVAVVFMPPTLIASIYGMNFEWMPELHWKSGYPLALLAMLLAALAPVVWFKRRGWF